MKLIRTEDIDIYYVTEDKDIDKVVNFCLSYVLLAVDTETKVDLSKLQSSALDPHSANISLVQVNSLDNSIPYILDFLLLNKKSKELFNEKVLMNRNIRKVIHYSTFDLKQFYNEFKTWPVNVWCTQTLMKSLGICVGMKASLFRGHSLKDMSRDYFDIMLDKTEATSSWGERPLKLEQLAYAGLDVGAPKNSKYNCLLLEGYHLFKNQLDLLNQQIAYESDQQAVLICAKMEYEGMYIDKDILTKILNYATEETNKHRNYLVEELGFTIYSDTELNDEGEWELVQVIPDKIKTLLNNNKDLVSFINEHITKKGEQPLSSLQADEVKVYLDNLELETDENKIIYDDDFLNYKYESINLIKNLLRYKKYNKLVSECNKYFDVINKNTNRVHAGFSAIGSSTGRMASSGDANLQQVSNTNVTINIDTHQF